MRLLTGVLPEAKTRKNTSFGEGFISSFAGIFKLMRRERAAPGAWATNRYVGCYPIRADGLACF